MVKILKWVGGVVLALLLLVVLLGWIAHRPYPEIQPGPEADELAHKMMAAVNKPAWDSTKWVSWTFMGLHSFVWNKEEHLVQAEWDKYRVILEPNTLNGKVWKEQIPVSGAEAKEVIKKAYAFFTNDAFWLNAVVKAFDPGTTRSLVQLEDGRVGLMVKYNSGGVTPGDSYLWILDDEGMPESWRMWVSVLPIGGIETSWEEWVTLPTGAKVATWHGGALGKQFGVRISNLKGGMTLEDIGLEQDPFQGF